MDKHKQYSAGLVKAILDTLDEDSDNFVDSLDNLDATQFFTSLLAATTYVYNDLTGDKKNNTEIAHLLNMLAVQQAVKAAKEDE